MNITKKQSKKLSYILRHAPEKAGLILGEGGWVGIDGLLKGLSSINYSMTRAQLDRVVAENDKQRFTIADNGLKIRAAQGHSVDIISDLAPVTPPDRLFHGTATRFLDVILEEGLKPMSRQHAHLSADIDTATKVGQRHGKPVILTVDTAKMYVQGNSFYQADNGVWLAHFVSPEFLSMV